MMSRTVIAWIWLRQALAAQRGEARATHDDVRDFYRGKRQAARFYLTWELPQTEAQGQLLQRMDSVPYAMRDRWF